MKSPRTTPPMMPVLVVASVAALLPVAASAAPSAEVAKRCFRYSYIVYPYKRPGSVRMSGDRQAYFKDCMTKSGKVPAPTGAAQANPQTSVPKALPASKTNDGESPAAQFRPATDGQAGQSR